MQLSLLVSKIISCNSHFVYSKPQEGKDNCGRTVGTVEGLEWGEGCDQGQGEHSAKISHSATDSCMQRKERRTKKIKVYDLSLHILYMTLQTWPWTFFTHSNWPNPLPASLQPTTKRSRSHYFKKTKTKISLFISVTKFSWLCGSDDSLNPAPCLTESNVMLLGAMTWGLNNRTSSLISRNWQCYQPS